MFQALNHEEKHCKVVFRDPLFITLHKFGFHSFSGFIRDTRCEVCGLAARFQSAGYSGPTVELPFIYNH